MFAANRTFRFTLGRKRAMQPSISSRAGSMQPCRAARARRCATAAPRPVGAARVARWSLPVAVVPCGRPCRRSWMDSTRARRYSLGWTEAFPLSLMRPSPAATRLDSTQGAVWTMSKRNGLSSDLLFLKKEKVHLNRYSRACSHLRPTYCSDNHALLSAEAVCLHVAATLP